MSSRIGSQLGAPFAAAFLFCLLISPAARGQDGWNVTRMGQLSYWGSMGPIAMSGDYAFLLSATYSYDAILMHILNVSDPQAMQETAFINLAGYPNDLVADGDYVYLSTGHDSLLIVDVSNPLEPALSAACSLGQEVECIAKTGNYICMPTGYVYSLLVVDATNPTDPQLAGSCGLSGFGNSIAASGDFAYVGCYGGLSVIDLSDPAAPVEVGFCPVTYGIYDLVVSGDYVYTIGSWGLRIVDVSDPENPVEAGHHVLINPAYSIGVWGNYVYVAMGEEELAILDVSDPQAPSLVAYVPLENGASNLAIAAGIAYVVPSTLAGLNAFGLSVPAQPELLGSYLSLSNPNFVALQGDHAYVTTDDGLQILNIADPSSPQQVGFWDSGDAPPTVVAVEDSYAYLAGGYELKVIDISDPSNPTRIDTSYTGWGGLLGQDIELSGNFCYVLTGGSIITTWDISDPLTPEVTANLNFYGEAHGSDLAGNYDFIANGAYGLRILDISDPDTLIEAGIFYTPDWAYDVAIAGDYAYIACYYDGFRIVDISDPVAPVLRGHLNLPDPAVSLEVAGQHAFVACGTGLSVVNIANPDSPYLVGSHVAAGYANALAVADNYAYVVETNFLSIYDCFAAVPVEPFKPSKVVTTFELLPAFPNPFNAGAAISFQLPANSLVKLQVFDTAGRFVRTLVDGWRLAGVHELTFDAEHLPSGIYLARMTVGDFSVVQKLVLMK